MLSAYEEERLAKIARNKAMLESLGMEKMKVTPQKRQLAKKIVDAPLRRSARVERAVAERARNNDKVLKARKKTRGVKKHRTQPASTTRSPDLIGRHTVTREAQPIDMAATARRQQTLMVSSEILRGIPAHTILSSASTMSAISIKDLHVEVPPDTHIGSVLYPVGKFATMMWLCPGHRPKFSLLQSHQVWSNAIVLFINVDLNDRYTNDFSRLDDSPHLFVNWFARNSLTEESPVIQQLIQGTLSSQTSRIEKPTHNKPTLLFFRFAQGPYVYGGRLGYVRHNVKGHSSSIGFQFELLDAARFCPALNALLTPKEDDGPTA
ncbi:Aste57867_23904 [Aphanomyces stellatus]|uniref:Aste57867_23904 protein n=1 Tax=Aphanomyces stellatus TaxID=120398 RepID=A0A485LP14_9STRA|nr:hypothetical protein As57867_023831 [Aphanomyces stellatus]VFU00547.1 Aste57867_23904 [Aphanomyces stellatus]